MIKTAPIVATTNTFINVSLSEKISSKESSFRITSRFFVKSFFLICLRLCLFPDIVVVCAANIGINAVCADGSDRTPKLADWILVTKVLTREYHKYLPRFEINNNNLYLSLSPVFINTLRHKLSYHG